MKKLKFFNYLLRDKVDLLFLIIVLMFSILYFIKTPVVSSDNFSEGNFSAILPMCFLFILGSGIWTKGIMTDLMREYIKDPEIRKKLNLDPIELSSLAKIVQIFFFTFAIIMLVVIFIYFLNL